MEKGKELLSGVTPFCQHTTNERNNAINANIYAHKRVCQLFSGEYSNMQITSFPNTGFY